MSKGGMCLSVGLGWVGEKSVWGGGGGERGLVLEVGLSFLPVGEG